jgi:superfamily II DNA or RNA helicase
VPAHAITRRLHAEELVRMRRADEEQRYVASQRAGRIDANPHQVDAVIFALQRLRQGGCILADEVGLGKTIEAGLVIAQLRAEGSARRVLLIAPRPLLGQWSDELAALFGIETREGGTAPEQLAGPGVFVMGRELAGGERGAAAIMEGERFDLCVIDEAHEIFAGIYKRFDRHGRYRPESGQARMASRVRRALAGVPVLLLTATPIQNSLSELWGLVQYVEPTGTLLGDLPTFRSVFCEGDDRVVRPGADEELKRRIAKVCQRTLRRQAQEFMKRPFVDRRAQLFEYTMSDDERALYDDVTQYLMRPRLSAFRGGARKLLLLGFHRRMASSLPALAASLDNVAARLQRMLRSPGGDDQTLHLFAADLEEDESTETDEAEADAADLDEAHARGEPDTEIRRELAHVQDLARRARQLPHDAKAEQLVRAVKIALARPEGSGKCVIFTESLVTQEYLRDLLVEAEVVRPDGITLFRGDNHGRRADAALARWWQQVGDRFPAHARPSRDVAIRQALVYEFQTRTRVFVATEAGAKGLNLQFCDTLVNYDLPWNPQRIEQRIGRCHRYGQTRPVVVFNFLARDNAAQRLTFEILSRKLDLFGTVLDASDVVLYEPSTRTPQSLTGALGMDLEAQLGRIYERARSLEEIEAELVALREQVSEARTDFEETYERTAGLIESRLDETVRSAFRDLDASVTQGLVCLDHELEGVVVRYLDAVDAPYRRAGELFANEIEIEASPRLPESYRDGGTVRVGPAERGQQADVLHLGHPLVLAALEEARVATSALARVRVRAPEGDPLRPFAGRSGRMTLLKVTYEGFEPVEHLLPIAVWADDAQSLPVDLARAIFDAALHDDPALRADVSADDLDDAVEEALFVDTGAIEPREQSRLDEHLDRIERFVADRILVLEGGRAELDAALRAAVDKRDRAAGADARTRAEADVAAAERDLGEITEAIDRLRARDDPDYDKWRTEALMRRYAPPRVERLLEIAFAIETTT